MSTHKEEINEILQSLEELEKKASEAERFESFFVKVANGLKLAFDYLEENKEIENAEEMLKEAIEQPEKIIPGIIIGLNKKLENKADSFGTATERKATGVRDAFEALAFGDPIPGFDY